MRFRGRTKLFYLFLILVVLVSLQGAGKILMQNSSSKFVFIPTKSLGRQTNGEWNDEDKMKRDEGRDKIKQQVQVAVSNLKNISTIPKEALSIAYSNAAQQHPIVIKISPTVIALPYLPHHNKTKILQEILSSRWVAQLHEKLKSLPVKRTKQVSIVFSDFGCEVLLNWLIASQVRLLFPLRNLVVVCLDEGTFHILDSRDIPSVLADRARVLKPGVQLGSNIFISTLKLIVCRLVNHFGYDAVLYDADAIPLRTLQPVFAKYSSSDIIGSVGSHPYSLRRAWGFTMSMGVVFFRSSADMGKHWNRATYLSHLSSVEQSLKVKNKHFSYTRVITWNSLKFAKDY